MLRINLFSITYNNNNNKYYHWLFYFILAQKKLLPYSKKKINILLYTHVTKSKIKKHYIKNKK